MNLEETLGFCLCSQEIRAKIKAEKPTLIVREFDEDRIQPCSFEPVLGDQLFVLDTEIGGIFRPQRNEQIYRTLLQLPGRSRRLENITNGFEIKKGFTYLAPLQEKIILQSGERIKSSPKSSYGRIFLLSRLLTDYNPCFDEVNYKYNTGSELNMWLLMQPYAFNMLIYPGLAVNQSRFFMGKNSQLTQAELEIECEQNPILYENEGSDLVPAAMPIITDGLEMHLDLTGESTGGIVGLRARHNPTPIDVRKKREYEAELFFEPIKGGKDVFIKRGEHYLFSTKEILHISPTINAELNDHSHIGFAGMLHFAGFADPGFNRTLVCEIRPEEQTSIKLTDRMPVSKLLVFRNNPPDKLYGAEIGSSYYDQQGPRVANFFKPFDFNLAARNYAKLHREVMVQDAKILNSFRINKDGFEFLDKNKTCQLYKAVEAGFFQSRYDCEFDETILQPIPYVVLFDNNERVFLYQRTDDIKKFGESRLFDKLSIGVGGHINQGDGLNYIANCIKREVMMEEVTILGEASAQKLAGTLMAYDKPVDRVHFGLVFVINVKGEVKPKEDSFVSGKMHPITRLAEVEDDIKKYETWSKCLIPYITELYRFSQQVT